MSDGPGPSGPRGGVRRPAWCRSAARWVGGLTVGLVLALEHAVAALAASPSPSRPVSTDTRSALEGPGFVGAPGLAIALVVGLGLAALVATLVYVRLSGGPRNRDETEKSLPPTDRRG